MKQNVVLGFVFLAALSIDTELFSQDRAIQTVVPFLTIAPD